MQSFVKIKPSRIGDITLSFTDIGKSCPVGDFFLRHKCVVLTLFAKINSPKNLRIYSSTF